MNLGEIRDDVMGDLRRLEREADLIYQEIVLPRWDIERHHFASTLYGYIMGCFAFVDLLSKLSQSSPNQTDRMIGFMEAHIGERRLANEIAIQMWRHALMHTGNPQRLIEKDSGATYLWLLHWGRNHMPPDQHMTFRELPSGERVLNTALFFLIEDVLRGAENLFSEASHDMALALSIENAQASVRQYRFERRPRHDR